MNANTAVVFAATMSAIAAATDDGRANRADPVHKFNIRTDTWARVQAQADMFSGWYQRNFSCSPAAFDAIVIRIEDRWEHVNSLPHHNAVFSIKDRVAVTLSYLTHSDGFADAGQVFGISESRAHSYVSQVVSVLLLYLEESIHLPNTCGEWAINAFGFETISGIPNVVGAIDGSLVKVKRFHDHEGWYCRKGFTAFNIQGHIKINI